MLLYDAFYEFSLIFFNSPKSEVEICRLSHLTVKLLLAKPKLPAVVSILFELGLHPVVPCRVEEFLLLRSQSHTSPLPVPKLVIVLQLLLVRDEGLRQSERQPGGLADPAFMQSLLLHEVRPASQMGQHAVLVV